MPDKDIALALSGGGYRAAFFNLGVLRKMHALRLLERVAVISSVSGGSIVAGAYARSLLLGESFESFVASTTAFMHRSAVDLPALCSGVFPWASSSLRLESTFRRMFGDLDRRPIRTSDLARVNAPAFIFNATAVHSGRGWRFLSGGFAEEWQLGQGHDAAYIHGVERYKCDVSLAKAVTASAAFPLFSAVTIPRASVQLHTDSNQSGLRNFFHELPDPVCLSDGGVRDNSGLTSILGHPPKGFEKDYYLIGSDAGATLRLISGEWSGFARWLHPGRWFRGPPRGRFRKLNYILRQFDIQGWHNNQLAVGLMLQTHRGRAHSTKGVAMLRMDEAVTEVGEVADRVGDLVRVQTRLRSPGHAIGEQLMTHGGNLLFARVSEYTDLLPEDERMTGAARRLHKDRGDQSNPRDAASKPPYH